MRALIVALTLMLLALPLTASARCVSYDERLLTPEVPAGTPLLLFELYAFDRDLPESLAAIGQQFLLYRSSGEKVLLTARATHDGMNLTQIELVPTTPLAPGTYRLIRSTRPAGHERESHTLTVAAQVKHAPRGPLAAPKILSSESTYEALGCGPREAIDVKLAAASPYHAVATYETPRYAFVTLTAHGTTERGFVAVAPTNDGGLTLSIGHGMCSGAFSPASGASYTATIQLVGPDGALGAATTASLSYNDGQ